MALLPGRQELRRRAADSLTLPDFEALTSLDAGRGRYLSLEARIDDTSIPISMELQRDERTGRLEYELRWGLVEYQGTVDIVEAAGEFEAEVTLDRFNGKRVYEEPDGKGDMQIMYRQGSRTERGGTPREIPANTLRQAAYWVPTIINHIARNVDYFLRELKEGAVFGRDDAGNKYRLESVPMPAVSVDQPLPDLHFSHASPSAHYRRSHERTLQAGLDTLTVRVTGAYVNTNWGEYSTSQVLASVEEHAHDILPRHFEEHILPLIAAGGHSYEEVREAYQRRRSVGCDEANQVRVA